MLTREQYEKWESLVRAARFGASQGKKNMIVDLDVLLSVADAFQELANECVIRRGLMEAVCKEEGK